jgi:hypothetical protein
LQILNTKSGFVFFMFKGRWAQLYFSIGYFEIN